MEHAPLIQNDAVVFGILMAMLGFVFWGTSRPGGFWKKFYGVVPSLLVCYFLPSLFSTAGIISGDHSQLYDMAKNYLLPTALVLLTLSIDFEGIRNLGPKALIMFFTGTVGIILGGPIAVLLFSYVSPDVVGGGQAGEVWRGLTTVAGSWIGGGANQTAMKEVFQVDDGLFSAMVAVDVIVANVWMACILFAAGRSKAIDAWNRADASAIDTLRERVSAYQAQIAKMPTLSTTMVLLAVGFSVTALSHLAGGFLGPWITDNAPALKRYSLGSPFFWLVVLATTGGLLLSMTRARELEGVGASRVGSVFIYVLVATIGMKMDLMAIFDNPGLFLVGGVWIAFHAILLIVVARLIRAPVFFLAVGSQANVGGAASAPIVASAFHPSLAPVGVLLAVLGYALGTYGAWICGQLMRIVSGG
jgi:uncharacterized membrane protein